MNTERPICILIAALGGQGGGVLSDWLTSAARKEGLAAQATSIPGVAQRTGATTYYFEVYPDPDPPARPVFSIYPAPGAVDLLVSFEPTEVARALSGGFIGPETTVITAGERIYSTAEKIRPGDNTMAAEPILKALHDSAARLRVIDMQGTAMKHGCHPNAVMFGAMAASGILPFSVRHCREAVAGSGIQTERNLAGFDAGMAMPEATNIGKHRTFLQTPPFFAERVAALPETVQPMAGHALAHLCDYQNRLYGDLYLRRLERIVARDSSERHYQLSKNVSRRLGAWMAFEDVIRVAQLKTRPERLERIRAELGIGKEIPLEVYDYLKPGREELIGLLPGRGGTLPVAGDPPASGLALKLKTSSAPGWAIMRFLAALKFWRPFSARYRREQQMIDHWLEAAGEAAGRDYDLACRIAELAVWARGYGAVRSRGFTELAKILDRCMQAGNNRSLTEEVEASLQAARAADC